MKKIKFIEPFIEILKLIAWTIFNFFITIWEMPLAKAIIIIFLPIIIAIIVIMHIKKKNKVKSR